MKKHWKHHNGEKRLNHCLFSRADSTGTCWCWCWWWGTSSSFQWASHSSETRTLPHGSSLTWSQTLFSWSTWCSTLGLASLRKTTLKYYWTPGQWRNLDYGNFLRPAACGQETSCVLMFLLRQSLIAWLQMSLLSHPSLMQGDPAELPKELVPCGLCVIHPGGLHLPDGGQSWLRGLQNSQGAAHRPLHQNPELAPIASPVQTHPLHSPVGGGGTKNILALWNSLIMCKVQLQATFFQNIGPDKSNFGALYYII